jgi:hypothetical protein
MVRDVKQKQRRVVEQSRIGSLVSPIVNVAEKGLIKWR